MSLLGILKEIVKSKKWYLEKKQEEKPKCHEMKDEGGFSERQTDKQTKRH